MKKCLSLLLVLSMGLTLAGCACRTNQEYYERAQLLLGSGDCQEASELFSALGEYRDAADYALYAAALCAMQEDEYDLARADLNQVHPFKSSGRYLTYLDALSAEESGDLEQALTLFRSLGSFEDSADEAERIAKAIPEQAMHEGRSLMSRGEYEAARAIFLSLGDYGQARALVNSCTQAIAKRTYAAADSLADAGDLLGALSAFTAMGDTLDAPERAQALRDTIIEGLDDRIREATLSTAPTLMTICQALSEDPAYQQMYETLRERFEVSLSLLEDAKSGTPCVMLGAYPMGESGLESPLCWDVIGVDGAIVTLLCRQVIDASPIATSTDLLLTDAESAAILQSTLPAAADLASMSDLTCSATPYAVAQGVDGFGGTALYWLRDMLESGVHPVVGENGALTLPAQDMTPGIRPMVRLNLDEYPLTAGSGTPDDPYRK